MSGGSKRVRRGRGLNKKKKICLNKCSIKGRNQEWGAGLEGMKRKVKGKSGPGRRKSYFIGSIERRTKRPEKRADVVRKGGEDGSGKTSITHLGGEKKS